MGRGDEVVAQGLLHVLVHLAVQGVGHLARRAAHEVGEAWGAEGHVSHGHGREACPDTAERTLRAPAKAEGLTLGQSGGQTDSEANALFLREFLAGTPVL